VLERRGGVSDADVEQVRAAGYSDGEIAEIVAHVAFTVLTNYFNKVADTDIDFPVVTPAGKVA
jgi:alkylhydroperoxidase family enzyme